jgi:TolB-like protein/cytochrome c-type biogenesis protein CcmH/NrfG
MGSLIEGYNYDIFISYRQKDNKHDGWVTEFVNNLKGELESTFKEEICVYFDINPHDGLLETHDVDASLQDKLRCLIFIPIISRTYCDPKSFAWEHEFRAFVDMASKDQFGLKIKLPNGNVANRVLPIRIHELNAEDIDLVESVLGVIRPIDFIYHSYGVNRPLRVRDDDMIKTTQQLVYRDQINKTANAIDEIILGLKREKTAPLEKRTRDDQSSSVYSEDISRKQLISPVSNQISKKRIIIILSVLICAIGAFVLFKTIKSNKHNQDLSDQEKTIAVLPFRNLSYDTTQVYFCDGFMEEILNNLQKVKNFTVRSRTSSDQYRDTKKSISVIGHELNADYLVEGSVGREGNNLKIWVQLIDSKEDKHLWSNEYTEEMKQIFSLQSEIAKDIANKLDAALTPEEIEKIEQTPTANLEAYNYYLLGDYYTWKGYDIQGWNSAVMYYEKAIQADPGFTLAYTTLARQLMAQYFFFQNRSKDLKIRCKQIIDKAIGIDPNLPEVHIALGDYYYECLMDYDKALEQYKIVLKGQPKNAEAIYSSACVYRRAGNLQMAKSLYEKAFELTPRYAYSALDLAETYDLLRDYSKARFYYNTAVMLQPDWFDPYNALANLSLKLEGDTKKAQEILDNASLNNKSFFSDSLFIETKVIIDIFNGKYDEALTSLSLCKSDVFQTQFYFRPKYLYYATIYGLMGDPKLEREYYDSTLILLEKMLTDLPEDSRLFSSLGITYAGLGVRDKAAEYGEKAVQILPVSKEAYRGIILVEDLAHIYVMIGKYDKAIAQLKYLLSIPGMLSTKILEIDPRWAQLRTQGEFKKLIGI